ncbi:hypothetical protein PRIC1_004568 [Phytophthora ramorum]
MDPAEPSTPTRDWAASTAASWAKEVEEEMRLQRRRQCIARCRARTKLELQQMHQERERLEQQVKQQLAALSEGVARRANDDEGISDEVYQLALESDALRTEALAIRNQLQQYNRCWSLVHEVAVDCGLSSKEPSSSLPVREASNTPKSILPRIEEQSGWRVHFPGGEPSFYYHPFTRGMSDNTMDSCASQLSPTALPGSGVGEFLGWNVRQATLASGLGCQYLVAKARFSKRVQCSLREAFEAMKRERIDSWPVIVTPMNWSSSSSDVSTIVLQRFDDNTSVLVRSVQGEVNLRYVCLVQRSCWTEREGKRVITYGMVIADSEANKRNRSVETNDGEVEWIPEGGAHLTLTEVNDKTTDVVYDHWGGCQGTLHAQYLFVQWAHYAFRWEQMVVPSRLLHSEA